MVALKIIRFWFLTKKIIEQGRIHLKSYAKKRAKSLKKTLKTFKRKYTYMSIVK